MTTHFPPAPSRAARARVALTCAVLVLLTVVTGYALFTIGNAMTEPTRHQAAAVAGDTQRQRDTEKMARSEKAAAEVEAAKLEKEAAALEAELDGIKGVIR
ncbi:hypothetical protein [Microbacterium sp. 77mftsu3.1]|uniref:hypothetical protein n=1 Tax=Microbacterium sp. 77mftsu3.1 TaxID=1761802 RepID=UPI0003A69C45|nr:hypothetical protein [Microbacterium sp. 77mftsu3.1]SDH49358.1 hypothetical protein SAMN04488590_3436 [Microbacterium sp. 77mftsu3.1]